MAETQETSPLPKEAPQLDTNSDSSRTPRISITPKHELPQKRERDISESSRPRQEVRESIETWEDKTLGSIFRISLKPDMVQDAHGNPLRYLSGVRADLEEEGAPLRLTTAILDQSILEAASQLPDNKPLDYLLACWKRVSRLLRGLRSTDHKDPKFQIAKEARRLCMSYCIFAITMPDMFGLEAASPDQVAEQMLDHLLVDPDHDRGICHEFLTEAVSRFEEEPGILEALVGSIALLSRKLSKLTMNDDYKPYMLVSHSSMKMLSQS